MTACKFQSTPLIRGETEFAKACIKPEYISIHSPHTRGDGYVNARARTLENFNPLPSYEGRQSQHQLLIENSNFNPLPSYEGRLSATQRKLPFSHFNPLPSHEGRPYTLNPPHRANRISIHSPHTRGDADYPALTTDDLISIHSPHTRGDPEVARKFN